MKAVVLTIEALALLNNEERKKEEVQNGTLAIFSLQASVWFWTPEKTVQLVIKTHDNED